MKKLFTLSIAVLLITTLASAQQIAFQRPPEAIEELVLANPTPSPVFNNDCSAVMLMHSNGTTPIVDVPTNELCLATIRIDPNRYCRIIEKGSHSITLKRIPDGEEIKVSNLPEGSTIIYAVWYPTGDRVLIFNREKDGVHLYSASLNDGIASRVSHRRINTTARKFVEWTSDNEFITACVIEGREAPVRGTPTGPIVYESLGKKTRKRTIQGLLRDDFECRALKFYFTSQLVHFTASGEKEIGEPALYRTINISPNREYLMVYRVVEPYSYEEKFMGLKSVVTIEDLEGNVVKTVKQRSKLSWRSDKPATLTWCVKAKKDNPDYKATIYEQDAPFTENRRLVVRTTKPFERIYWCNDNLALVVEKEKDKITISNFKPGNSDLHTIVSYDSKNIYELPGEPIMVRNQYGRKVVWCNDENSEIMFAGEGYTSDGQMPNLTLYKLENDKTKVLWRCKTPYFEKIIAAKDPEARIFITSRESFDEPTNFYLCDFKKRTKVAITDFPEPYPTLKGVTRKLITYKRADGLELKSFVWLPADYNAKRDGKLPILLWAYPRGYKSAEAAMRAKYSQYTHPKLPTTGSSMLFWLTQGYCVMESMAMPLIPINGDKKANDSFVKQLVMNAEAAIKALSDAGFGDENRVGIGGHSYGAFMTANLLSHTKLFKAGIARSGAYNRTLTPYGFQDENRNYWSAKQLYHDMSPFSYADKLSGSLLLIHGSADQNSGTHTIQSQRYFQALRGHKKHIRYVELPNDGHTYQIRENILHYLYEANLWLEKYVKNAEVASDTESKRKNKKRKQ